MSDDVNNPFNLLLENMQSAPVDLAGLAKTDRRTDSRIPLDGQAIIYSRDGKVLSPAVLRNVSPGGLAFEIKNVFTTSSTDVTVVFGGSGFDIGIVKCTIQWVAPVENHPQGHKIVGLQYGMMTEITKKKLERFFDSLKALTADSA
jgi:hypothetical protein